MERLWIHRQEEVLGEPLFAVLALEFGGGSCRCGFELVCHVPGEVGLGCLGEVCGVCLVKVLLHDGLPLVSGVWELGLVLNQLWKSSMRPSCETDRMALAMSCASVSSRYWPS